MDVVFLASVYDKAGVSLQEERDFAARLHTHNPGQSTVKLVATCHAGFCEPDKQVFKDEVQVEVIPPLTLILPLSGKLLLPQGGHTHILTSHDGLSVLTYKLFCDGVSGDSDNVISVSGEGEIFAGGVNGHAVVMIIASEEDTGLNQSTIVHVEVGTVVALSLSPLSLAQATPNSKHHAFPLGYSAEFRVTLLDSSGRPFDFAEIPVSYRLNRFDIVRVTPGTNGTYIFKAASKGQVIIRVFLLPPHSRIGDYIRVHVGYAIIPSLAVVHVGAKVCFTTHLTEESMGEWSTGDGGVMQLSPETGIGTAKSPGRAVIYHKIKGVSDTHTEITVKRVEEVVIKTNEVDLPLFTNAQRQKELRVYSVPVSFYHTHTQGRTTGPGIFDKGYFTSLPVSPNPTCSSDLVGEEEGGRGYIQQVPFQCLLELKDSGSLLESQRFISARAHFDHKYGTSSCFLLPNNDHQAVEFLSTKEKLSLSVKVKAFDSAGTYEVFSSPVSVPLLPAFSLSRDNITLTSADPSTTITVTGLPRQLQAIHVRKKLHFHFSQHIAGMNGTGFCFSQHIAGVDGTGFHFSQHFAGVDGTGFHFSQHIAGMNGTEFRFPSILLGNTVPPPQQNAGKSGTQFHSSQLGKAEPSSINPSKMLEPSSINPSKMLGKVEPSSIHPSKMLGKAIHVRKKLHFHFSQHFAGMNGTGFRFSQHFAGMNGTGFRFSQHFAGVDGTGFHFSKHIAGMNGTGFRFSHGTGFRFSQHFAGVDGTGFHFSQHFAGVDGTGFHFSQHFAGVDGTGFHFSQHFAGVDGTGFHFSKHIAGMNGTGFRFSQLELGSTFPSILLGWMELGSTFPSILLGWMELGSTFPSILLGWMELGSTFPSILLG